MIMYAIPKVSAEIPPTRYIHFSSTQAELTTIVPDCCSAPGMSAKTAAWIHHRRNP
jgi:hypothetical protein